MQWQSNLLDEEARQTRTAACVIVSLVLHGAFFNVAGPKLVASPVLPKPLPRLEVMVRPAATPPAADLSTSLKQSPRIAVPSPQPAPASRVSLPPTQAIAPTPNRESTLPIVVLYYFNSKQLSAKPYPRRPITNYIPYTGDSEQPRSLQLTLFINESGLVDRVTSAVTNLDPEFQERVTQLFRNARFQPGEIDGIPVKSQIQIEVSVEATKPGE